MPVLGGYLAVLLLISLLANRRVSSEEDYVVAGRRLPLSLPRSVGQVPVYYARKNTGRPPTPDSYVHLDDIPVREPSTGPHRIADVRFE